MNARAEIVLAALLVVVLVGSVLAIGAVHVPVLLAVAALALSAGALAVALRVGPGGSSPASLPAFVMIALAAFTALQTVPLPIAWLRALAPRNAEVWTSALALLHETPSSAPVSLDPGASLVEVTRWLTYAAVFTAASVVASRRGGAWGVAAVFASALVAALTTIGHGLAGATRVFGLYEPNFHAAPWHVGPLLNANNLAGYLNLGALCGAGLLLMRRPLLPRWLTSSGIAAILGVEIISASRGGVLVLPIGVAALVVTLKRRATRGGDRFDRRLTWVLGGVLASGVLFALLGASGPVWTELYDQNAGKAEMLLWAEPLVIDHPWLGIGRGAFESVFPAYSVLPGHVVYTHAENFVVQWAAEWGLPVAVLALGALAWAFRPQNMGVARSAVATGAWIGVFVVLVQNLFDLALEVPAVCIALATVLGSLWGDGARRGLDRGAARGLEHMPRRRALAWAAAAAAVGLGSVAATAAWGMHDLSRDRAEVRALFTRDDASGPASKSELMTSIGASMRRHPAEPYFPLTGALAAFQARDESPMPWLDRALTQAPSSGRAHLALAEVLQARGATRQALMELRLSQENDPSLAAAAGARAVRWTKSFEELSLAAPEGWRGASTFDEMSVRLRGSEGRELAALCDEAAIRRDQGRVGPRVRLANDLLAALEPGTTSVRCMDREPCFRAIEAHARELDQARPAASLGAQLRAKALLVRGDPARAEELLAAACSGATDRVDCLVLRASAAAGLHDDDRLRDVEQTLRAAACAKPVACADALAVLGNLRVGRGDAGAALAFYEKSAAADPTDARLLRLADAASHAGEHLRAVDALRKLVQKRGGNDAAIEARIAAERAAVASELIRP